MIQRIFLAALFSFGLSGMAGACDMMLGNTATLADFPPEIVVAHVRVLDVQAIKEGEYRQRARLQVLEALRGEFPGVFGAISRDEGACGFTFREGKELVIGLIRRTDVEPGNFYAYEADARTELWVQKFYANK